MDGGTREGYRPVDGDTASVYEDAEKELNI